MKGYSGAPRRGSSTANLPYERPSDGTRWRYSYLHGGATHQRRSGPQPPLGGCGILYYDGSRARSRARRPHVPAGSLQPPSGGLQDPLLRRDWRLSAAAALTGILLVAFSLRLAVVGIGPVLEDIRHDTEMSSALAGVLTTIPFICMGAFALGGSGFIMNLGRQRAITAGLVLLTAGTVLRAAAPSPALLIFTTIPIGLGIAVMNVAIAGVVKDRFPRRPGAATGAYVASMSIGSAAITGGVVPLAHALGGWREAFVVSAAPTVVGLVAWIVTRAGHPFAGRDDDLLPAAAPRRLRAGILLGLTFGFQCICYAAIVSWGPAIYTDEGWSESRAGFVTAVLPIVTIVSGLLAPTLSDGRDRRPWVLASAVLQTLGMYAIAFAPTTAPLAWVVLFAFGNAAIFALSLTLALDMGRDPKEAAWLTSWTLGIGFLMSAPSPVVVGALRDLTGSFTMPIALIGTLGLSAGITAMMLQPRRAATTAASGDELPSTRTSTRAAGRAGSGRRLRGR
jgi:MFS transporter, CP family, cyanate transporter